MRMSMLLLVLALYAAPAAAQQCETWTATATSHDECVPLKRDDVARTYFPGQRVFGEKNKEVYRMLDVRIGAITTARDDVGPKRVTIVVTDHRNIGSNMATESAVPYELKLGETIKLGTLTTQVTMKVTEVTDYVVTMTVR